MKLGGTSKGKMIFLTVLAAIMGLTGMAQAVDLKTVYRDAVLNDATFKRAEADWLVHREALPIAASSILPQIGASSSFTRSRDSGHFSSVATQYQGSMGYAFNVSQKIFDFGTMANIWSTKAEVGASYASYLASAQDLLQRTIKSYLNVLYAQDVLYFRQAYKSATNRLYEQAKQKFKEGLIAITDLEEAKKDYDLAVAEEIGANNDLACALESLEEISGVHYIRLDLLKEDMKMVLPSPRKVEAWVDLAERQNYDLKAAEYGVLAARHKIKQAAAGHLPVVSVGGGYKYNSNNFAMGALKYTEHPRGLSGGLSIEMPVFNGGRITAETNQAHYAYQRAVATQDYTHKSVVSNTRQAYLGIISYASKVQANLQAVVSSRSALQATYASYTVGSRTMADVLTAQSRLYETQTRCAQDRYRYILEWVNLKRQVGSLSEDDIEQINNLLTNRARKNADLLSAENLFGEEEVSR